MPSLRYGPADLALALALTGTALAGPRAAVVEPTPGACTGPQDEARVLVPRRSELRLDGQDVTSAFSPCGDVRDAFLVEPPRRRHVVLAAGLEGGPRFDLEGGGAVSRTSAGEVHVRARIRSRRSPDEAWDLDLWLVPCERPTRRLAIDPARSRLIGVDALAGTTLETLRLPICGFSLAPKHRPKRLTGVFAFRRDLCRFGLAVVRLDLIAAQCLEASLGSLLGSATGEHTLSILRGSRTLATSTFGYDATPPAITAAIEATSGPVSVALSFADAGCAEVAPATFRARLDGVDVSSSFAVTTAGAAATLPRPPPGTHTLEVSVSDAAGNEGSLSESFLVQLQAVGFELRIVPGGGAQAVVGVAYDLEVRALDAQGQTATGFVGAVTLSSSSGQPPLEGHVLSFTGAEPGVASASGVALFSAPGAVTVSAQGAGISGSLSVNVVAPDPAIVPGLPALTNDPALTVTGVSFPLQAVVLLKDGQGAASTVAGADGAFGFATTLTPAIPSPHREVPFRG